MPLLAGPGSISLMIIVAGRTDGLVNHGIILLGTALLAASTAGVSAAATRASAAARALGQSRAAVRRGSKPLAFCARKA